MGHRTYKNAISVRGDCLYCPLPLSIDSYWNCLVNCHHCYFRALNRAWGTDLRPANPEAVRKKLENGLKNLKPRSSLAWALKKKKTLRLGNKSDPFQPAEGVNRISADIIRHLIDLKWTFVIQTRFVDRLCLINKTLRVAHNRKLLTIMPIISPGAERDWEMLERKRTTPIPTRLKIIRKWIDIGWKVGVNGEPFIPGFHTVDDFRDTLHRLKDIGVTSYNTYNLHLNDLVAKNLAGIGLDIKRIWRMNQDEQWRPIQRQLCDIADEVGIKLGCPDFVNTGANRREPANTCCGIDVPNPSRFNAHHFKRLLQNDRSVKEIVQSTWEGIGDYQEGHKVLTGRTTKMYTMKDAGMYDNSDR